MLIGYKLSNSESWWRKKLDKGLKKKIKNRKSSGSKEIATEVKRDNEMS